MSTEELATAPDVVTELSKPKKPNKIELKRQQIYEERRRRLINSGIPEDKVDQTIAAQDYAELPVEKKIQRLEQMLTGSVQALVNDIQALQHNDKVIADALDINMKAMSRCLDKAGISLEDQSRIIAEVAEELRLEDEKAAISREQAQADVLEKQVATDALMEAENGLSGAKEESAPSTPDGATVFGD